MFTYCLPGRYVANEIRSVSLDLIDFDDLWLSIGEMAK